MNASCCGCGCGCGLFALFGLLLVGVGLWRKA